jgi:hypothetical protein
MNDKRIDWLFDQAEKKSLTELLDAPGQISFDWHGRAMLQVLKKAILSPF